MLSTLLRDTKMRITERKLRHIIRESILSEQKMLDIITSPYEDVEVFNILANYALNDDIQGALKDPQIKPYVDSNDMSALIDQSHNYIPHVGKPKSGMDAPPGWNPDAVDKFLQKLEGEAYNVYSRQSKSASSAAGNQSERKALAAAFTMSDMLPEDIKSITYQTRMKGGKLASISLEDHDRSLGNMTTDVKDDTAKQYGTTLDDILKALEAGGAKQRKRRQSSQRSSSYYD